MTPKLLWKDNEFKAGEVGVLLGKMNDGSKAYWNPSRSQPHLLISGKVCTGKSNLIHQMLCTWHKHCTPEHLHFLVFDIASTNYRIYRRSLLVWHQPVEHPLAAVWAMTAVCIEIERRMDVLARWEKWDFSDLPPRARYPRLFLVIDELHYAKLHRVTDLLRRVLGLGGAVGVHVVATAQDTRGLGSLEFGVTLELEERGRGRLRGGGHTVDIQTPYISDGDIVETMTS